MKKKLIAIVSIIMLTFNVEAQCDSLTPQRITHNLTYNASSLGWFDKIDSNLVSSSTEPSDTFIVTFQAVSTTGIMDFTARTVRAGCDDILTQIWKYYDEDCNLVSPNYTGNTIFNPYTNQQIPDFYLYIFEPCKFYTAVASYQTVDSLGNPCVPDTVNVGMGIMYYALDTIVDCENYGIGLIDVNIETFNVYPNPATDIINFNTQSLGSTIQLFNSLGQLVYSSISNKELMSIDVSQYNKGVYSLLVISEGTIKYSRLIIQ